jgi:hypothetical protein
MADTGVRVRLSRIPGHTSRSTLSERIYLPALLNEFALDEDGAHIDYDTIDAGEFSVPQFGEGRSKRKLRSSDLEALTLYWPAPWLHPSQQDPDEIEAALYRILRSREPVEILVRLHQIGWDDTLVRMKATFRNVRLVVKPGEADAKYWQIPIKEWRARGVDRRGASDRGVKLPTSHRLDGNDTLESLSKRYYGSKEGWRAIAAANGLKKWGRATPLVDSKRYKVGSKVKIPRKPPKAKTRSPERRRTGGGVAAPS